MVQPIASRLQTCTGLNTVGNCNTTVSIIIYYNLKGPLSHTRFIVDRNVIIRCIPVLAEMTKAIKDLCLHPPNLSQMIKNSLH